MMAVIRGQHPVCNLHGRECLVGWRRGGENNGVLNPKEGGQARNV